MRPEAGKFRSFLIACLKNFLANERERGKAQRRGGGQPLIPLDSTEEETRYSLDAADHRTLEAVFEQRWAFVVLDRTMQKLRREHSAGEKRALFDELKQGTGKLIKPVITTIGCSVCRLTCLLNLPVPLSSAPSRREVSESVGQSEIPRSGCRPGTHARLRERVPATTA